MLQLNYMGRGAFRPVSEHLKSQNALVGSFPQRFQTSQDKVSFRFAGLESSLKALFPTTLPVDIDVSSYKGGKQMLVNGTLETWQGKMVQIPSVVMLKSADSSLKVHSAGELAWLTKKEAMAALDSAKKAYGKGLGEWPSMTLSQRIDKMAAFVEEMKHAREVTAKLIMLEIGKNKKDACKEFDRTVEYIENTLQVARELDAAGSRIEKVGSVLKKESLKPRGVTLCLGPSNYPLNETFTTLIPSLLMGNTAICKLPKLGALSVTPLYGAFARNFPKGAINFISGDPSEVVTPLVQSGEIDTLAFIGGTRTANAIAANHPNRILLNEVLGLASKNAGIILPNTTLNKDQMQEIVTGALSFNGQRCTALKMLFAPKGEAEAFAQKLASAVNELKIGMPYEADSQITPLPLENIARYKELLDDAVQKGAKVINPGGGQIEGTLFKPAVLYPVTSDMRLYHEEQFGPLVPVATYEQLGDPVQYIANQEASQQVSLFGSDAKTLQTLVSQFQNQVCRVNINSQCQRGPDDLPFGGRKGAAKGILSVKEALLRFSLPNLITLKATPENEQLLGQLSF